MQLFFDQKTGEIIKPGRVSKVLTENFLTGTPLPSWLNLVSGSLSITPPTTSEGRMIINGNNSSPRKAEFSTFEFDANKFEMIRATMEGLSFSDETTQFWCGLAFGLNGIAIQQLPNINKARLNIYKSTGTEYVANIPFRFGTLNLNEKVALARRNVSLILLPKAKEFYIMEDDQVTYFTDVSSVDLNAPIKFTMSVQDSTNSKDTKIGLSKFELELVGNL